MKPELYLPVVAASSVAAPEVVDNVFLVRYDAAALRHAGVVKRASSASHKHRPKRAIRSLIPHARKTFNYKCTSVKGVPCAGL